MNRLNAPAVPTTSPVSAQARKTADMLRIEGLSAGFGTLRILNALDLVIDAGETLVVLGESGCGKTTLLKATAGLIPIASGEIHLGPHLISNLPTRDRGVVYLDQEPLHFEHLSIFENVAFAMRLRRAADFEVQAQVGLLHVLDLSPPWRLVAAVLWCDGWLYLWHRLNHRVPFLWRFHKVHHADASMDVTTATRFHPGEHAFAVLPRLGLITIAGLTLTEIVCYESLVVASTMFHHANISRGRLNRPLRWLIVTPGMHSIHHCRDQWLTGSNYATVFSL